MPKISSSTGNQPVSSLSHMAARMLAVGAGLVFAGIALGRPCDGGLDSGLSPRYFHPVDEGGLWVFKGKADLCEVTSMEVDHPVFSNFERIEIRSTTENGYDVSMNTLRNPFPIKAGEIVFFSCYARAGQSDTNSRFRGYIQSHQPEWVALTVFSGTVGQEWTRIIAYGRASQDLPVGSVHVGLHLSLKPQTIDLAAPVVASLPPSTDPESLPFTEIRYPGMEPDAPWREVAQKQINQHRKGVLRLQVVDAAGQPVEASVEARLVDHEFQFASFVNELILADSPGAEAYRKYFLETFNAATTPVYWADWGWANKEARRDYLAMARFLREQELPVRGHVLLYPGFKFSPSELTELRHDRNAFINRVDQHLREIVPLYRELGIHEYDVINELRDETDWVDLVGLETVAHWFKLVKQLDPKSVLYINENTILTDAGGNIREQATYFGVIQQLLELGAPIDGIGMQGHFSDNVTSPERIWSILDHFASLGLPIRITEFDLSTRDLQGQAGYERDLYTAAFAHPSVAGITRWGFYEPLMYRPQGALVDSEWNEKPNSRELRDLIKKEWGHHEMNRTDRIGQLALDAFYGKYDITVETQNAAHTQSIVHSRLEGQSSDPFIIRLPGI